MPSDTISVTDSRCFTCGAGFLRWVERYADRSTGANADTSLPDVTSGYDVYDLRQISWLHLGRHYDVQVRIGALRIGRQYRSFYDSKILGDRYGFHL